MPDASRPRPLRVPGLLLLVSVIGLASGCGSAPSTAPRTTQAVGANSTLQRIFGPPSAAAFGSAVFVDRADRPEDLEAAARRCYQRFVGPRWAERGESTWMASWRRVHARTQGDRRGILAELKAISDPQARSSIGVLLDANEQPDAAKKALAAVYDDPEMRDVEVYALVDGAALSGVSIAGRARSGAATVLVFLMD